MSKSQPEPKTQRASETAPGGAPGRQRAAGAAGGDPVSLAAPPRLLGVGCRRNNG